MDENITHPTTQLPPQLSTISPQVDWMYDFIFWVSVVFFVGITASLVYFMWRYRRRPGVKSEPTGLGVSRLAFRAWGLGLSV